MKVIPTPLKDAVIIEPQVFGDDRGFFFESYNEDKMRALGLNIPFRQDSHSASQKGVLRGLHFQHAPKPMAKLVRVTRGRVWDVAVDARKDSPTYKQWFGVELSAENKNMFFVPAGFLHGFYALEDCEFVYKCSETFDGALDANIRFDDPELGIDWHLEGEPILSERDKTAPLFSEVDLKY